LGFLIPGVGSVSFLITQPWALMSAHLCKILSFLGGV